MAKQIVITDSDRRRLGTLINESGDVGLVERRYLDDLEHELERAKTVGPEDVPADVITMNSRVRLRDLETKDEFEYQLVYPNEANADDHRVSILAPMGTALIGYRQGDTIEWPIPAGVLRLKVEEILYQPERVGKFDE